MDLESSAKGFGWCAFWFGLVMAVCWIGGLALNAAPEPAPKTAPATQGRLHDRKAVPRKATPVAASTASSSVRFTGHEGDSLIMAGWLWLVPFLICYRGWRKRHRTMQALDYQARAMAQSVSLPHAP